VRAFAEAEDRVFAVHVRPALLGLQHKVQTTSVPLSDLLDLNQAIALKHDRAAYLSERCLGPQYKRVLDGRDIGRYQLASPEVFLRYEPEAIHSCKREDIFLTPEKLFFRRVGASIQACYDDAQHYALNTLVVANAKTDRVSLRSTLALINSRLLDWYFTSFLKSTKEVFSEIQARQMARLPIRHFPLTDAAGRAAHLLTASTSALASGDYRLPLSLATQALATHALLHGPAGKPELRDDPYWAAQIATADPDFPGREDFVHDLLAMLAQRMMDLNREKHEVTGEFLTWLEHSAGCQVDDLSNKTKLQAFWEHDTHTLTDILRKNRRKLTADPTTSGFINKFVREHGQAVAKLTPILDALQRTDDLIDQIVYKLYGLTDEEIAIVEGTAE
jgi:hypothetical protein